MARWPRAAFLLISVSASFLLLLITSPANATGISNPGDQYVFGADSPVFSTSNIQSDPSLSGNICLWQEYETYYPNGSSNPSYRNRLYYKDLTSGANEPGHALIETDYNGGRSAISRDPITGGAKRVVWTDDVFPKLYFRDVDFSTGETCQGNLSQCAMRVYAGSNWQTNPAVSPNGSQVAWEDGGGFYPQVYLYDFNSGVGGSVSSAPNHKQSNPSLDNEWLVWTEAWNYNDLSVPINDVVYAKRLGSSDPPIVIADNGGNPRNSVSAGKIGRNGSNEPVITYLKTYIDMAGFTESSLRTHTISGIVDGVTHRDNGADVEASPFQHASRLQNPINDAGFALWEDCPGSYCNLNLHDNSTNVTQTVNQALDSVSGWPQIDSASGYIAWQSHQGYPSQIYFNKVGEKAQTLAERYAPNIIIHPDEYFRPRNVDIMINGEGDGTKLQEKPMDDAVIAQYPDLNLDTLYQYRDPTSDGIDSDTTKYLNISGDLARAVLGNDLSWGQNEHFIRTNYRDPYDHLANSGNYPETTYAHVARDSSSGRTIIQFWLMYYFDYFTNLHEGDWEHIDVVLDGHLQPSAAGYSQHGGGTKRLWQFVEGQSSNPSVFVAQGSHANYFSEGDYGNNHAKAGDSFIPSKVEVLPEISSTEISKLSGSPYSWLAFQGLWGQWMGNSIPDVYFNGPQGPLAHPEHDNVWDDPFSWFENTLCWDAAQSCQDEPHGLSASVYSPVDVHLYDAQGRHVGKNASGGIDEQIPNAEYIEVPALHQKSVVVHGGDINSGYRVVLQGTGNGTFDCILNTPDTANNSKDDITYQAVPVTVSTGAQVTLDSSKNYAMQIDTDGNGNVDEQKLPDNVTTSSVDINPPAQTFDLTAMNSIANSALLLFSAPGDDGNSGIAQYYDIRYSSAPITAASWKDAMPLEQNPSPLPAGTQVSAIAQYLTEGTTYYFALKAIDDLYQESPLSNIATVYIRVDSTDAGLFTVQPAGISSISINAPYTGDENADGSALIEYKLSGDASWATYGSGTHPEAAATIAGLTPGASYDIRATYQDPDGVNGNAVQEIDHTLLPTPPAVSQIQPAGTIYSSSATLSASLSADFGIDTNSTSIILDSLPVSGCTVTPASVSCPVTGLAYGSHVISGQVADMAGNQSPISGQFNVGDNASPLIANLLPAGGPISTSQTTVSASFSDAQPSSGINTSSVVLSLDGMPMTGCSVSSLSVSCPASGLTYGAHTISGSLTDNSGNQAAISGGFSVDDQVAPTITAVQPSGTIYTPQANITISYSDPAPSSGISQSLTLVKLDGNPVSGCSISSTSATCPVTGLTVGAHTISGQIADGAVNQSPVSGSFNLADNQAPVIGSVLPSGTVTYVTTIDVSYSEPAPPSGVNTSAVTVRLDGSALTGCTVSSTSASCPAGGVTPGSHTISGSVPDYAGNTSTIAGTFTLVRNYYWSWYDNSSPGFQNWVLMANPAGSSADLWFNLTIAGTNRTLPSLTGYAPGQVPAGRVLSASYPGVIGGPVNAVSTTGAGGVLTQRTLLNGHSLEEVPVTEKSQLSDHYYWPWYDNYSQGTTDWVLLENQNAYSVYYEIKVGSQLKGSGTLGPGASVSPNYPGVSGGPLQVQAWTNSQKQAPASVIASERVTTGSGGAFNELPGISASSLSSSYLWTWYDNLSSGVNDYVLVVNQNAASVYYELRIGGVLKSSGIIQPGAAVAPNYPGLQGGPVQVQAWTSSGKQTPVSVVSSQRVNFGPSFEEVPGLPQTLLTSDYLWPWYDNFSTGVTNWVLVANLNAFPVYYEITVAGQTRSSGTIQPGSNAAPNFPGVQGGPVEVRAWTSSSKQTPANVLTSQRVLWSGYFNEMVGVGN